ncbi:MAG: amino acid permease, partial [Deltaproteobacteria bacterium]|nr:amino acid permease [Deltaproteobacteria bacterium]
MSGKGDEGRSLGLWQATGIGLGATVGGGLLALAGVAISCTGPSAVLAFVANGLVALLSVLSFAELAARFPESGGTYAYARKVLSVEAAFAVGWVMWFASVVASVLYAMGFATFLVPILDHLWRRAGAEPPPWLASRWALVVPALAAVAFYTWGLTRSRSGGGQWATVVKVVLFGVLLVGGAWGLLSDPPSGEELAARW